MSGGIFDETRGLGVSRESRAFESSVMDSSEEKVIAEEH